MEWYENCQIDCPMSVDQSDEYGIADDCITHGEFQCGCPSLSCLICSTRHFRIASCCLFICVRSVTQSLPLCCQSALVVLVSHSSDPSLSYNERRRTAHIAAYQAERSSASHIAVQPTHCVPT